MRSNVAGVDAACDCAEFVCRQAVVAVGMGWLAALEAGEFLAERSPD